MKVDFVNLTVKRLEGLTVRANPDSTESQDVRKFVELILCSESDVQAKILDMHVEMRERVLQEMLRKECWDRDGNERMFSKMLSAFMLLLSPLTRSLDLSRFFSFCPKQKIISAMEEVLGWISIMAPAVNHLILEDSSWNDDRKAESLSPDVLRSLSELDKLSRLQAGQSQITFSDLLQLCQSLPNLRFLKVFHASNFDPEIPLEVIKRSLGHLRALVCTLPFFAGKNWLLDFFAKLPNIEVFDNCSFDIDARDFKFRNEPHVRFLFFSLDGSLFSDHNITMLRLLNPNVTHLMVEWTLDRSDTCKKQDELLKFQNIEALSLQNVQSADTVIGFVRFYGENLHTLILAGSLGDDLCFLSLNLILKLSPNLKTLSLDRVILEDDSEPLIHSARLTELNWKIRGRRVSVLTNILSAPELKRIELTLERFDLTDLAGLTVLVTNNEILNQLESLNFCWSDPYGLFINFWTLEFISVFLKRASAFLPKLIDLRFTVKLPHYNGNFISFKGIEYPELRDPDLLKILKAYYKFNFS